MNSISGSSIHYPASENNYTNSNSMSASIGSNQDTLWHMKLSAAAAHAAQAAASMQHPATQIYVERPPSAFSSCGGSDPLTQYVVDYVGYPVPPPPHITSVAASGSQHSFQNGSHMALSIGNTTLNTNSSTSSSNSSQRFERKTNESSLSPLTQQQSQPIQRFGTLKKSKQHTQQHAPATTADQQLGKLKEQ